MAWIWGARIERYTNGPIAGSRGLQNVAIGRLVEATGALTTDVETANAHFMQRLTRIAAVSPLRCLPPTLRYRYASIDTSSGAIPA
ncbi:hypothetical protein [Xanthomonas campestris]|uniref:hypothetical protein n=1 Tax=Xanthomonas campestris TaxID=339 RepID=UPI001E39C565|nr:hypothetical protein [Xanthomonas campestris]MCC8687886.1 hypothetical protein [Xanthomonas campestris]MCC8691472.1 hypothetical protein [Xanthomonas campestris]MCW2000450.1 hypothetical protein [Xanthomonas campestris]MEA9679980.1 hypothetical protein [Xanthomonas campestris pv. raphani]MEA9700110.1 hypothetical protein [Xanthomonas campestris pv. raphani]